MELNGNYFTTFWNSSCEEKSFWDRFFSRNTPDKKELSTPALIQEHCLGITLKDRTIKSILFSTDLALIENNDSDAVLAVYPFAPSVNIMKTLINFSDKPVICGIGGGITQGNTALQMAIEAEKLGAAAVIVNQPFKNKDIRKIKKHITIPLISSISSLDINLKKRVESGVSIFHVTGGSNTVAIIEHIKENFPDIPYICTGGKNIGHLQTAIKSGTHAVVLTPPSNGDLFKNIMQNYRSGIFKITKNFM